MMRGIITFAMKLSLVTNIMRFVYDSFLVDECGRLSYRAPLLTLLQIGVKFGGMYGHPPRKRLFPEHFFGMIVSVFRKIKSRF